MTGATLEVGPCIVAACPTSGEGELLASLRRGEAGAFERLMRAHNRLLFRAARGIVKDDAEAQDIVQETYLRAFLSLGSFRGDSSLATWLVRIAINQALAQQRRRSRHVAWNDSGADQETDMQKADAPERGWDDDTPESAAWRSELRRRLEDAIDLLPPIYKCVFMLRAVEGLSVEETAAALDVTLDVVRTRYLRARGMLRSRLDGLAGVPLSAAHDFRGRRCDEMASHVLTALRAMGVVRDGS